MASVSHSHVPSRFDKRPRSACPELIYFQPDQLIFLVTYKEELSIAQVGELLNWAGGIAGNDVRLTNPRRRSFPALSQEQTEITYPTSEAPCQRPVLGPRDAFDLIFADVEGVKNNSALVKLILELDESRDKQPDKGFTLELASPNWLASGAPHGIGTGGPGSPPVPFTGDINLQPHKFRNWPLPLDPKINHKSRGEGVTVAILDTAPCPHDMAEAYHEWHDSSSKDSPIERLLGPDSVLEVHNATYADLLRLAGIELNEHPYQMTDHGLFVASIIHAIAPRARLHLIEVLNPYGVGDLESITAGLGWVLENLGGKPLVVNCSLVLNAPLEEGHYQSDPGGRLEQRRTIDSAWLMRNGWPLGWICDLIFAKRSRVIAAAGNDRTRDGARPQARFPAALTSVLGVGALPRNPGPASPGSLRTASYSNICDIPSAIPEEMGITTLGGEPGENEGVLGLYIGEFPDGSPNETGWAWWAGTSFAAPVISGATAAVLSSMVARNPTTQDAIEALLDPLANGTTVDNEHALVVTQG